MDKIIQSLSQSPIVHALDNVEHSLKRFTNDIPDNAPYRTLHKRVLEPSSGDVNDPNSLLRFKVLRHGHLNKMYLRASLFFPFTPLKDGATPTFLDSKKTLDSSFFASFFTSASLYIGGKCVETLYPETILLKAIQASPSVRDSILYLLKGRMSDYGEEDIGDGAFDMGMPSVGTRLETHGNFLIPLDFSIFQFAKDSLDTAMLQQCYVDIRKRAVRGFQTEVPGAYTRCKLVCKYFNTEHFFKNELRNANFPKGNTTLLTMDNIAIPQHCVSVIFPPETKDEITEELISVGSSSNWTMNIFNISSNPTYLYKPDHGIPDGAVVTVENFSGLPIDGTYTATVIDDDQISIDYDSTGQYHVRGISPSTGYLTLYPFQDLDTGSVVTITDMKPASLVGVEGTWTLTEVATGLYSLDGYVHPPGSDSVSVDLVSYDEIQVTINTIETFPGYKICTFDLNTIQEFVTDIMITFRKKSVTSVDDFYGDVVSVPTPDTFLKFTLMSEDTVLFEKQHYEMLSNALNVSDQYIHDVSTEAELSKSFGPEGIHYAYRDDPSVPLDLHNDASFSSRSVPNMYRIPLTMFHGEEFQNGGINLRTMTNVKLIIEGGNLLDEVDPPDSKGLVPHIVLRHRVISRVDSATGSVRSHF